MVGMWDEENERLWHLLPNDEAVHQSCLQSFSVLKQKVHRFMGYTVETLTSDVICLHCDASPLQLPCSVNLFQLQPFPIWVARFQLLQTYKVQIMHRHKPGYTVHGVSFQHFPNPRCLQFIRCTCHQKR
eukprot:EG_transcript_25648